MSSLASQKPGATLVTIPASNYVEKARWALRVASIPFVEEKWAPVFAYLSTMPKGGRTVPLLTLPSSPKVSLTDSADIVAYCAEKMPALYPNEKAKELETFFDAELGPHARRCAYFVVFQNTEASKNVLANPVDGVVQRSFVRLLFPGLKLLLQRGMDINEKAAEQSWLQIEAIVDEAEKKLGDGPIGSRYLAGDTFSAADISFCSHLSLLVLPPEHEFIAPYISLNSLQKDSVFHARLEKLQQSKIGQYVLWCYKNKRPASNTP